MTSNTLITVDFHGHPLITLEHNGDPYVAVRPICEYIGLDARGQLQRIQRHPVLSQGVCMTHAPSAGGAQVGLCLRLGLLNGWLFGIDATRVKPELRERVVQYQRECFDVLAAYWQRTPAPPPQVEPRQDDVLLMQRFMISSGLMTHDEAMLWRTAPGVMSRVMIERKQAEHGRDELLNAYRKLADALTRPRRRPSRAKAAKQGTLL